MRRKRSRLMLLGVLALSASVAVGLASGAAEAKKKGKKKGAKQVTVAKTTPTTIPVAPNNDQASFTQIPLTVGKKAKGKVVSGNSVSLTFSLTGPPVTVPDNGNLGHLDLKLTSPSGRTVFVNYPDDHNASALGPVTVTADSPIEPCEPSSTPPPPPCDDPEDSLGPPYAGTMGDSGLALFTGVSAKGTWTVKFLNFVTDEEFTVGAISLNIGLQSVPKG